MMNIDEDDHLKVKLCLIQLNLSKSLLLSMKV